MSFPALTLEALQLCLDQSTRVAPRTGGVGQFGEYLSLRSSLELSLERVATGVWVEHHRGSTRPAMHRREPCAWANI